MPPTPTPEKLADSGKQRVYAYIVALGGEGRCRSLFHPSFGSDWPTPARKSPPRIDPTTHKGLMITYEIPPITVDVILQPSLPSALPKELFFEEEVAASKPE